MRTRGVWTKRVLVHHWVENHLAITACRKPNFFNYDDDYGYSGWEEPRRRLHGDPRLMSPKRAGERYVLKGQSRELYGWLFMMSPMGIWDMFERMARQRHPEWRDEALGPYLRASQEAKLISRGLEVLPRWYGEGREYVNSPWMWRRASHDRGYGVVHFVRLVLSSRWWSDRMGVGAMLLTPNRNIVGIKCHSTAKESWKCKTNASDRLEWCKWKICLHHGNTNPVGVALEMLREPQKENSPVSALRFKAFAHRFWGHQLTCKLTEGIL